MRELALHVLDILQNALEAGARHVRLTITEDEPVSKVVDPFFTSRKTRHVGLGLPLWATAVERAGGEMSITSNPGVGTTVTANFRLSHPDRQPLGDIKETLLTFLLAEQAVELYYHHQSPRGASVFDTTSKLETYMGNCRNLSCKECA